MKREVTEKAFILRFDFFIQFSGKFLFTVVPLAKSPYGAYGFTFFYVP